MTRPSSACRRPARHGSGSPLAYWTWGNGGGRRTTPARAGSDGPPDPRVRGARGRFRVAVDHPPLLAPLPGGDTQPGAASPKAELWRRWPPRFGGRGALGGVRAARGRTDAWRLGRLDG